MARSELTRCLDRLGVTPEKIRSVPQISHIIKQMSTGKGKTRRRGIDVVIDYLRGSEDEDAKKFLDVFDSVPIKARKAAPIEAFCIAAHITTKRIWEVIQGSIFEQSSKLASTMADLAHPEIVEATIKGAKNVRYGGGDRKMMHLHQNFLPVPKTTIIGKALIQDNRDQSQNTTVNLPPVTSTIKGMSDRFGHMRTQQLLEAPKEEENGVPEV